CPRPAATSDLRLAPTATCAWWAGWPTEAGRRRPARAVTASETASGADDGCRGRGQAAAAAAAGEDSAPGAGPGAARRLGAAGGGGAAAARPRRLRPLGA